MYQTAFKNLVLSLFGCVAYIIMSHAVPQN